MHANWEIIRARWPHYRVGDSDASLIDASDCVFVGEGRHEFVIYSFDRYVRRAQRNADNICPIGIRFGVHFPEYVSEEEPAIGHLRTRFSNDTTGLVEPVKLLAVVATNNGPEFWNRLWERLEELDRLDDGHFEVERWIRAEFNELLDVVRDVCLTPLPQFQVMPPPNHSGVSMSLADIPKSQFKASGR